MYFWSSDLHISLSVIIMGSFPVSFSLNQFSKAFLWCPLLLELSWFYLSLLMISSSFPYSFPWCHYLFYFLCLDLPTYHDKLPAALAAMHSLPMDCSAVSQNKPLLLYYVLVKHFVMATTKITDSVYMSHLGASSCLEFIWQGSRKGNPRVLLTYTCSPA